MKRTEALRLGILVSGRGTNLLAILDAIQKEELKAKAVLVVCNHSTAQAIVKAQGEGVTTAIYEHHLKDYNSRLAGQQAIADRFESEGVDLIVCAGWDRVLTPQFVRRFEGRIINIHPSLLPAFAGGLHAVRQALSYGVKIAGCTVHFVTEEVDAGPIISQAAVPVLENDTVETLAERLHKEEHRLLIEAIKLYSEGRLQVEGRVVRVLNS
ncbi:MAG: phosphoribosylglycinamide formyltransferase [Chloroflexota bacterium]|nr:phosphoribosylglycinamide formyltransferase [Chloroflexota bacterium]